MFKTISALFASLFIIAAPAAAQQISDGETFLAAVEDLDAAKVMPMLQEPGSRIVNFRGYKGDTAIIIAARKKEARWVNTFLSFGADPDVTDKDGDAPLHIATRLGSEEIVRGLLRSGASVDIDNRWGETPLIHAVQLRKPRLVKLYLEAGADPDRADRAAGYSARDYAARDTRNPGLLKLIEQAGENGGQQRRAAGPVIN